MSGAETTAQPAATAEAAAEPASLLDQAIAATRQTEPDRAKELVETFVAEALRGTVTFDRNLARSVDKAIRAIDAKLSEQLNQIMHHEKFTKLEGSWRGLHYLVMNSETSTSLKLKLLNVSKRELHRDLTRAVEFDQSQLFKKIYENEFGTPGGEPYGALIGDYEWTNHPDDIESLRLVSNVAAAAFAPLVIAASPALFGVDEFSELSGVADPASAMAAAEYQRWKRLSVLDDSRFLAVTLPRLLMRLPWVENPGQNRGFRYQERMHDSTGRVTCTAGYLVAACVIRAFDAFSWPADIRGYDIDRLGGGVIENLPEPWFSTDPADGFGRPAPDVMLTDRQERALVAAGLLPVCALPYGGEALIGAARSLQTPAADHAGANAAIANANARLSAQFNSVICVSRFAHYVKIMGRDMTGAFKTAPEVQRRLHDWLMRYTNSNPAAGPETMARYPLRDASVAVEEVPGKPGVFSCAIHLQPHFQLDDVAVSFRLMTELASPGQS
jgi:type VI secretion system protein ImpD/type VI secretion system protein ImpC